MNFTILRAHSIKHMMHRHISWIGGTGCTRLTLEQSKTHSLRCSKVKLVHPVLTDPLNAVHHMYTVWHPDCRDVMLDLTTNYQLKA